ncbi:MAG: hypothetical protein A2189_05670 [Paenibacillus sp. RIFOXYA1_FULL_44_5]|nr:MAG: hypothetical protein A2189_05670 [Paenibacillus sp. RIFOXYA1_FULL_44_5]
MGGYGAFVLALRNPDVFGAAVSLSGALGSSVDMDDNLFMQGNFARMIGPRKGPYAAAHDVYRLAQTRLDENRMPNLYFNCGKQDFLYEHNLAFHETLQKIDYAHDYEEFEGEHTWPYWQEHVVDALKFIQAYFQAAKS